MLEGVVKRGTGRRISTIGKPLAGKTGTTNESRDTWFVGFSPDLAVGVYVDRISPGLRQAGNRLFCGAPIFKSFMEAALKDKPAIPFRVPPGFLARVSITNRRAGAQGSRGYPGCSARYGSNQQGADPRWEDGTRDPAAALRLPRASFAVDTTNKALVELKSPDMPEDRTP